MNDDGAYGRAVALLGDLRALAERDGRAAAFDARLADLRAAHRRKRNFLACLNKAGLG